MKGSDTYLMENLEEALRLEVKTDPEAVRRQALWCGLRPGLSILDAGCGPGKVTSILHGLIRPGGRILGLDYSEERIRHAQARYAMDGEIEFRLHDLRYPFVDMGSFDLIWARFLLEYHRTASPAIVKNLHDALRPGGTLCLLDLDHNCLSHYPLPDMMEETLFQLMERLEKDFDFDPYAGRKLYAYLYDLGYEDITAELLPHHLFYGDMREEDMFNWVKKVEMATTKARALFSAYPGGHDGFFGDFRKFFSDPRRFTYTPLIMVKGTKPLPGGRE